MSVFRIVVKRVVLGLVAAWTVLTTVFAMFSLGENWVLRGIIGNLRYYRQTELIDDARAEFLAERGLDRPLLEQYVDWMGNMLTLEWGNSFASGEPAFSLVMDAVSRTAMYVLPALGIAIVIGIVVGLYAGLRPESRLANGNLSLIYLLFALPNFWVGGLLFSTVWDWESGYPLFTYSPLVFEHLLPIALTTTTLLGGYASYARAHSLEYTSADFVALVKAKGANRRRIARHVVRNAAIPLFSLLFTEALALLVLAVFIVETVFGIEGFGLLLLNAVQGQDLPVLLSGTMVVIGVGVLGNIIQDLSYTALDPRVDTGTR